MEKQMDKEKILIIEPDQALAGEVVDALSDTGAELTVVDSHFKGLAMLEDDQFSLVLVSADNSGIDGLEFCRIFRKRQEESKKDLSYLIILGQEWQKVAICENQADAHDFLARPFLDCELKWRISAGLKTVQAMRSLRDLIYLDSETGVLNKLGLKKALKEEVNRLGRKKAWLSVAVVDFQRRDWLEVSHGKEVVSWIKIRVFKHLRESLRNYDQVAQIDGERICIISGDCDYHCFTGLFNRIDSGLKSLDCSFPTMQQPDITLTGIVKCITIDSSAGGSEKCFEHIWTWLKNVEQLPEHLEARVSFLNKNGICDSDDIKQS